MLSLERHALLTLSEAGRRRAWALRGSPRAEDEAVWRTWPDIPAICTGRRTQEGLLRVGFSFPLLRGGVRVRIASAVPEEALLSSLTPWELPALAASRGGEAARLVREHAALAADCGVRLGVFGAAAMELATEQPYLHENSDLDLVIELAEKERLRAFWEGLKRREERGVRADVELRLAPELYCKLTEWMQENSTVLCRGGAKPVLLSRRTLSEITEASGKK